MSYLPPPSLCPVKKIKRVQFGILSPQVIIGQSVAKIEHVETTEKGRPKSGGLADHRMGCIEKNMRCYTCHENMVNCPGHFGHIELESPVYHIGFIKVVKKILECICLKCARFRLLPTDPKYINLGRVADKFRFAWDVAKSKKKECPYKDCGNPFVPIKRVGVSMSIMDINDKKKSFVPLSAADARAILERITDDTCRLIGLDPEYARPEWMIVTVLGVAPPCVRPSVNMDFNGRGEDDLTHVYSNILRYNSQIQKLGGRRSNGKSLADLREQLQIHVTALINNNVPGLPQTTHKSGRPTISLSLRLKGKTGRIRGHIMGKRVDFSARTVITGDPNISVGEVGVPISIAKTLTFPERITSRNIAKMQHLVNNSPEYPSANYVINGQTNVRVDLRSAPVKPQLEPNDIVERHMVSGDLVLFNRQPTLHKMSMMAHRVRVMPGQTFRLNVNTCSSYNADFDGDEMNLHFPQTLEAMAELEVLTTVSKLLVSPQASKPVNALVQDSLMGMRKFTKRDTFLCREEVMELMLQMHGVSDTTVLPEPAIIRPVALWTGKQVFSMFLPEIDLVTYHSTHPDDESVESMTPGDTRVLIQNGVLLTGIISKKAIGATAGGLIHIIYNDYGHQAASDFLDNAARVLNQWLVHQGFSVGIGDAIVSEATAKNINEIVIEQQTKSAEVLEEYMSGSMIPQGNLSLDETKEQKMQMILAKARDTSGKLANQRLHVDNNLKQMVEAGSKGSILNICQISACVGQQIVEGKRIPLNFGGRSLPHFHKGDDSADARGFIGNSFLRGLRPEEMYFAAMGGREGLIDTAVKTAETGYIQRRLIKAALEDVTVRYDGTVRDSRGNVIQFVYGDDGFDGTAIENQVFESMLCSDAEFYAQYHQADMDDEFTLLTEERNFLRENMRVPEDRWPMPLNLKRIVKSALREQGKLQFKQSMQDSPEPSLSFNARYIFDRVMALRARLRPSPLKLSSSEGLHNPSRLFHILLLSTLSSKQVLQRYKLNRYGFDWALKKIEDKFKRGLVHAAESVGVLAAQSIGEPATQMTLNTFHLSGTGNKTVTSGIPRLKELINVSKNIKTPGMTVYLQPPYNTSKKDAERIKVQLQHATLNDVVTKYEIFYDPAYRDSILICDRSWMDIQTSIPDEDAPEESALHPWVFRLEFSRQQLYLRDLTMVALADKILDLFDDEFFIMHSDDNNENMVMHIRVYKDKDSPCPRNSASASAGSDDAPEQHDEENNGASVAQERGKRRITEGVSGDVLFDFIKQELLSSITVCGVPGIEKTFISRKQCSQVDPDTGILASTGKEYVIETDGINMRDCIFVEGVDPYRLTCNDPRDILSMFGTELAGEILLDEIRNVTEGGGSNINYRHLSLLRDVMTHRGNLMAITRHGIRRTDAGPLMKCTFEQTVDILNDAAMRGRSDDIQGVAEHIMLGAVAPLGTGTIDVLLDQEMLHKCKIVENVHDLPPPVPPSLEDAPDVNGYCPLRPSYLRRTTSTVQ